MPSSTALTAGPGTTPLDQLAAFSQCVSAAPVQCVVVSVTVMVRVTVLLASAPSLTVKLIVRIKGDGLSAVFWYVTARRAAW